MDRALFHPAVAAWFDKTFAAATPAQVDAWPLIKAGKHTLIAAPTGSGKTLAAFLAAIDDLVRTGLEHGLPDETRIVYVSPLKALSNDVQRNLEGPLAGIAEELRRLGLADLDIRPWVRTGDTAPGERQRANRKPPHIVVTTPESLYVLLGSESGRKMLATTRTVIVDEIHAVAPNKRGSHLALSLERLDALCGRKLQRIGLSATQNPIEEVARFLTGEPLTGDSGGCAIVDSGHRRHRDLAIALPESPLESVMSHEVWEQVYGQLATLVGQHRTTLIFVNTRRLAERVTRHLSERLGTEHVRAHHGSLSRDQRFDAEQRLKAGRLKALIATASLELGIDIGDVDLVCQIGSPRSIASFLQRVGRSGHAVGATPKGRLFPLSRDELVECSALLDSVAQGELDRLTIPEAPLDVVAQQLVAEVAAQEWGTDELLAMMRRAWPYRALAQSDFDRIVAMLADGFSTRRGRRGALLHHDAVNGRLRGRRGARLTALTAGGTIPDNADYQVLLEPDNHVIGSVNEDFAVESLAGDVFQLGNRSYRIQRVERGTVRVEDAEGAAPNIPFWLGEAPGRSNALSAAVSRLREEAGRHLRKDPGGKRLLDWLTNGLGLEAEAARQLVEYLAAGHAALGVLPTQSKVVLERFFDEAGGMQLVLHSPYGSRLNRAWGLALRKRFCATFNFEIQAAATEDNIVISLTQAHSFALEEVARYLHSNSARQVLIQAVLDSPMFTTRWRWVAAVSLALPRMRGGKKVPPQLARMAAEDLVGAVFPDQIACAENLPGDREIPDHPLVEQAIADCLGEAMDAAGFERVLKGIESGAIEVITRDLNQPSPLALEVLSARPYAFLDDAPLEERRTQAVLARRWLGPEQAADLGRLDAAAIARVLSEAWPDAETADELHDALCWLGFLTVEEAARQPRWNALLDSLSVDKRAALAGNLWIAAERLPQMRALRHDLLAVPAIEPPVAVLDKQWSSDEALVEILRGRLEGLGPVTEQVLAAPLLAAGLVSSSDVEGALLALQREGFVLRGRFTSGANADEWCDRRLLARIHHYTIKRLRSEIEPVAARDFLRFLFRWQRVSPDAQVSGPDSLDPVLAQLEGFGAAAAGWESEILPARLRDYRPSWLDARCLAGHATWMRLRNRNATAMGRATTVRTTPITILARRQARLWRSLPPAGDAAQPGPRAQAVVDYLAANGASFYEELQQHAGLLRSQLEEALAELVALGLVTSDGFAGLRALLVPPSERTSGRRRRRVVSGGLEEGGRWSLLASSAPSGPAASAAQPAADAVEHVARVLLRRWGVVFWRLLERESGNLPAWRELLRVFRRLEASGEIRGGRFVAGFTGEQFALPEAVGLLREVRRRPASGEWTAVSGADPLNLAGILTPGPRLPAHAGNRLLFRDGIPAATLSGGEIRFVETLDAATEWFARKALVRRPGGIAANLGAAGHSPAPLAAEG